MPDVGGTRRQEVTNHNEMHAHANDTAIAYTVKSRCFHHFGEKNKKRTRVLSK